MQALIDGDILVYSAGFSANGTFYMCGDGKEFKYKKEAVKWCEDNGLNVINIQKLSAPEPVENALHSVKLMIENIISSTNSSSYKIYLTGDNNFRETVATLQEYKGNRTGDKPCHYDAIRNYLVKHHNAIVTNGYEADDAMGVEQYTNYCNTPHYHPEALKDGCTTIIASLDKDLQMIPGWHYNWQTNTKTYIDEKQANYNFYKQCLTGDRTDNILGIPGIGKAKAEKLISKCSNEAEMYECVEDAYLGYYNIEEEEKVRSILFENARLLWIGRELDEHGNVRFNPPEWRKETYGT